MRGGFRLKYRGRTVALWPKGTPAKSKEEMQRFLSPYVIFIIYLMLIYQEECRLLFF